VSIIELWCPQSRGDCGPRLAGAVALPKSARGEELLLRWIVAICAVVSVLSTSDVAASWWSYAHARMGTTMGAKRGRLLRLERSKRRMLSL
jgi:hypothetical protein